MKKIIITSLFILGTIGLAQSFSKNLKPAKQELPEITIQAKLPPKDNYIFSQVCPRNLPENSIRSEVIDLPYVYRDENGRIIETKHCVKCTAGVYSLHENEDFKRCSFCSAKEGE